MGKIRSSTIAGPCKRKIRFYTAIEISHTYYKSPTFFLFFFFIVRMGFSSLIKVFDPFFFGY